METKPITFHGKKEIITGKEWTLDLPSVYQIEVFDRCNLACEFCPTGLAHGEKWKIDEAAIDVKLFETILERDLGASRFVELQQRGEPTLHPHFFTLVTMLKQRHPNLFIGFSTHGNFLTKTNVLAACTFADYITISIDGATKESYESKRVNGNWDKLWAGMKKLALYVRDRDRPVIDLQIIEFPGWEGEWSLLNKLVLEDDDLAGIVNVRSVPDTLRGWYDKSVDIQCNELCVNPWTSVSIHTNGDVVPCCMSFDKSIVYGNLREQSLSEIWKTSTVLREFREQHRRNELPDLCSKCYARSPSLFHDKLMNDAIKNQRGWK